MAADAVRNLAEMGLIGGMSVAAVASDSDAGSVLGGSVMSWTGARDSTACTASEGKVGVGDDGEAVEEVGTGAGGSGGARSEMT